MSRELELMYDKMIIERNLKQMKFIKDDKEIIKGLQQEIIRLKEIIESKK